MQDCECNDPVDQFLTLSNNSSAKLKNTLFQFTTAHAPVKNVIIAPYTQDLIIESCVFCNKVTLSNSRELSLCQASEPLIDAKSGNIITSTVRNFPLSTIFANAIIGSTFENCGRIAVGEIGDCADLRLCTFTDCDSVSISDGSITGCSFTRLRQALFATNSDITNCEFQHITCDNELFISIEDGIISHCVFENITLTNDSYLIEGYGDAAVEHCHFKTCRTSRDDLVLAYAKETTGTIFKRTRKYDILIEDSCTGLDNITYLQ